MALLPLHKAGAAEVISSAIVDDDHLEVLARFKWNLGPDGYPERRSGGRRIRLHQQVVGPAPQGKEIDHINRNKLDARSVNLRVITGPQNRQNVGPQYRNRSKLRGVQWDRLARRWKAAVRSQGKLIALGYHDTPEAAAAAAHAWRVANMPFSTEGHGGG